MAKLNKVVCYNFSKSTIPYKVAKILEHSQILENIRKRKNDGQIKGGNTCPRI